MSEETNKQVVRRFIEEMWNRRRPELADELVAPDCVTHQLRADEPATGMPRTPESVKREMGAWFEGFPDLTFRIEQLLAEGDLVVARCMMHGTHAGTWMGVTFTGRKVSVPIITIHRIARGKIIEDWVLIGTLALFQQLGLVAPTEEILQRNA